MLSRGTGAKSIAGGLRLLLRYLYLSGSTPRQLAGAVPPAAAWKLAGLPARMDAGAVSAVMRSCDRATVTGRRDYAILLLLARLGLRAHEAAGLELDDIRWRQGTIVVRRKGGRSEELPLPADAGQAIADYLAVRPAVAGHPGGVHLRVRALAAGDQERGDHAGPEPLQGSGNPRAGRTCCVTRWPATCWRPGPRCRRSGSCSGTAARS